MKTPEQIKNLLPSQLWYDRYVEALNNNSDNHERIKKFLNGQRKDETTSSAFSWSGSSEGWDFWCSISSKFYRWYREL